MTYYVPNWVVSIVIGWPILAFMYLTLKCAFPKSLGEDLHWLERVLILPMLIFDWDETEDQEK